jgi:hypothetical protein
MYTLKNYFKFGVLWALIMVVPNIVVGIACWYLFLLLGFYEPDPVGSIITVFFGSYSIILVSVLFLCVKKLVKFYIFAQSINVPLAHVDFYWWHASKEWEKIVVFSGSKHKFMDAHQNQLDSGAKEISLHDL